MKICYVSALPKTQSGGPKHSVPKQVNAQAKYDEVLWINVTPWGVDNSEVKCRYENDLTQIIKYIKNERVELVVFEDVHYFLFYKIAMRLRKMDVPYVIVPRGSLTKSALKLKWLKKKVANIVFFNRYIHNALAIEYLTEIEAQNSGTKWNKKFIVVPNGADRKDCTARMPKSFQNELKGIFIGRINQYHKGIDLFLDACDSLRDKIIERNCRIDFYGPSHTDELTAIQNRIKEIGLADRIHVYKEVHGEDKDLLLRDSDFFILTSRFEGLPMGLLEALSYGLPSIVTHETNIGEKICRAGAGFSTPCTVDGIIDSLSQVLCLTCNQYCEMSKKALLFAKEYDWDTIAKKAHEQYMNLIGE